MSEDTHDESIEYPDGLAWEDMQKSAAQMFNIWVGGSELEWAKECWEHFAREGLLDNEGVVANTASIIRLVTLALIYQQFSDYAWDENPENAADDLAGGLPFDDVALGYLATIADKRFADGCDEEYDLQREALNAVTNAQREEVFKCLSKAYGGHINLYASMCKTHPSYEEDEEFDASLENVRALNFVSDGFPA